MRSSGTEPRDASTEAAPTASSATLLATVFVTGGSVMVVEIVGTRILSPVFGVGIFVWSALLAVTMGSLALGYYLGGYLADRRPRVQVLFATVLVSGVLVALAPLCSRSVLAVSDPLGLRAGALLSGGLLFGPSVTSLGMIGPMAVRLANRAGFTGRAAGMVYAVSTVGSLVGTLLTGFVLVPLFANERVLATTSALLIVVGAAGLVRRGRLWPALALAAPAWAWIPSSGPPVASVRVLETSQSLYGRLQVLDVEDGGEQFRYLRCDRSLLGAQRRATGESPFHYVYVIEGVHWARSQARTLLQIGLGIGSLPRRMERYGIASDVVEIDPEVVRLAREYFGFEPTGDVFVEDARTFLRHTERRYDLIVHDTFTGGSTPAHLLSVEVLERIRQLLEPGGVLLLNMVGYHEGAHAGASFTVARTLRAVFPVVRCVRDHAPGVQGLGNLTFFASLEPIELAIPAAELPAGQPREILANLERWEVLTEVPPGPVATDSRNPLERLQLPVTERFVEEMRALLPREAWLN